MSAALIAETTKFRTLRSARWTLVVMFAVVVGSAVVVAGTSSVEPDDTVVTAALAGTPLGLVVAGVFGATTVCSEYSTGLLTTTYTAMPHRTTVLAAKATVAAAATLVTGLLAGALAVVVADQLLAGASAEVSAADAGQLIGGVTGAALCLAAVAVVGCALGALLLHATAAVCAVTALTLFPFAVGPLLPAAAAPWVSGLSVAAVSVKLAAGGAVDPSLGSFGPWPSFAVLVVAALGLLALGDRRLRSLDV